MFATQTLRRAVQINAEGTTTICGGRRQTWTRFQERVARLAGALKTLDVGPAERGRDRLQHRLQRAQGRCPFR